MGEAFTEQQLVSFGNYLLSQKRAKTIKSAKGGVPASEKRLSVCHADLENWKTTNAQPA